jgi:intergrase/recombinase/predicted transcriptional regulator
MSELNTQKPWFESVNVKALGGGARRRILDKVREKLGYNKTAEVLDISKGALHNYLHGVRKISDEVVEKALQYLTESEFREIVQGVELLKATGIVKEGGAVDYSLALQVVALAMNDEYLKNAIIQLVVSRFKEDVRKALGISFAGVKLHWTEDFEQFLVERKKRRKVRSQETLQYYKSIFLRYLEGKELSEQLIDYVVNHENKWLRNVFRHYIQYLYHKRLISPETFGWIMEVVPSRGYKLDVRPYQISLEDVVKTLQHLKQHHEKYYLIYRLMIESGLRISHAIHIVKTFNPKEVVEIPEIYLETSRLVCFSDKGFCRYYVGIKGSQKPCEWAYFSIKTLKMLNECIGNSFDRRTVTRYAIRHGLLAPKYMRKVSWRLMVKVMPREVARFIQSRFGELKISEARYEDLLSEADEYYQKYLSLLQSIL